jgi:hypothetical protein
MSERANGWLLIFGGLAIGLVLWLSPSQSAPSWNIGQVARHDLDGLRRSISPRHQSNARPSLVIWLMSLCPCMDYFQAEAD